jgi:hypothetical protein
MGKIIAILVCVGLVGIGHDSFADKRRGGTCTKAKKCSDCSTANGCTRKCKGAGCKFAHSGAGGADFYCPGGKCTLSHTGAGGDDLYCKGGGCTVNHDGAGSTTLHCPGGGCTLIATGVGTSEIVECDTNDCKLECHDGAGVCTLNGTDVPAQ